MYFYVSDFVSNAKIVDESNIVTPINTHRLWDCLNGYPNRDYVVSGFKHGFHIGIPSVNSVPVNNIENYKNSKKSLNRAVVIDKMNIELKAGRILGPYTEPPLQSATYSPLYVIPKSEPGKFRLIHDLSKPKGTSVNDNIPDSLKSVQYCSVMDVAKFLQEQKVKGDGQYYMAKIDLKDAYRVCPINKEHWQYLGMKYEDKLFIDTCLPMGLGTSCAIFSAISDSLCWLFHVKNPDCKFYNYIDDFIILAPTKELCESALSSVLSTLEWLGFPISEHKTVTPSTHIEFLGLGIDSKTLSFYVPDKKRAKISEEITKFLTPKAQRVHTIQKLVGKLNFLCSTFVPGKALMAGLYQSLAGILSSHSWARRRINNDVRQDLNIWLSFLAQCEGKPFRFIFPETSEIQPMTTDAAGSIGYGGVFGNMWFRGLWQDPWWYQQNIALLELVPIYIGIKLWHNKISHSTLNVFSDNESVVAMIKTYFSREKLINKLLKDLALFCMTKNIVINIQHVSGCDNILADRLSRNIDCAHLLPEGHIQWELPNTLRPSYIKDMLCKTQ